MFPVAKGVHADAECGGELLLHKVYESVHLSRAGAASGLTPEALDLSLDRRSRCDEALMVTPTPVEILGSSIAYGDMEQSALDRLASIARTTKMRRGLSLFRAGDDCPGIFIMHTGVVRLSCTAPNGKMHVLRFAEARHSFAEAAVIGRFRCPVDADVIEAGVATSIPADALLHLLATDHDVCLALLTAMSLRNKAVVERATDIALRDAAGRLANFLLERSDSNADEDPSAAVRLMVSKRELAHHLNLTSETLSRVLRRLCNAGVIEVDLHHEVRIIDRSELRELAWEKKTG